MTTDKTINDFQPRPRPISEALQELVDDLNRRRSAGDSITLAGIETGFSDLDRHTSGMRPGSLIVIASRPSMGKSTFTLNIASHVAMKTKLPVLMFSMELSAIAMASKLLSQVGKIETWKLRTADLDENDRKNLDAAKEMLKDVPLIVDETTALTAEEIIAKSRDVIARNGRLGLIVIDYLQLMEPISSEDGTTDSYEKVMSVLKTLARETDTPIILLSQLKRKLEKRRNKRPRMSDLPARAIGQYSDLLMFLYRDECYNPDSEYKGMAEIVIGRHRYGPVGMLLLGAMKLEFSEFSNYEVACEQTVT
ncbi:MAG: DnaB-like helicase C-terminal domain-containing protein [Gallionella sp.]|nr:DnaB-like helicase C-terminal domain-containing protein [Gallionella sp.]